MRLRARFLVGTVTLVSLFAVPGSAPALPTSQLAQCSGAMTPGDGPATCSATFFLDQARDPSEIGTHANFHTTTATGNITMDWLDQNGVRVAHYDCSAPGLYVPARVGSVESGAGPADATSATCSREISDDAVFARGLQTLTVTATATTCRSADPRTCPFHGYLSLKRATEPV